MAKSRLRTVAGKLLREKASKKVLFLTLWNIFPRHEPEAILGALHVSRSKFKYYLGSVYKKGTVMKMQRLLDKYGNEILETPFNL